MSLFVVVALTHFLALLSPGPDFFLLARSAVVSGWRVAGSAALGIALANGVVILLAFSSVAALPVGGLLWRLMHLLGGLYLIYLGVLFIRYAGRSCLSDAQASLGMDAECGCKCLKSFATGFLTAILNPKNALFYLSLAALLSREAVGHELRFAYGVWMFSVVLCWDFLVVWIITRAAFLQRLSLALSWLERISGALLLWLGSALLWAGFVA